MVTDAEILPMAVVVAGADLDKLANYLERVADRIAAAGPAINEPMEASK